MEKMKIYTARNGTKYIKLKSGRVKFVKSGSRTKKSSSSKTTRTRTMAKRRYKKAKTYRKSSSMFGKLNRPITGALGVVAYESFISPMIPMQGTTKDLLELGLGYFLSKKKGIIGATGHSLLVINAYQIASGLAGDKLKGLFNSGASSMNNLFGGN